MLKRVLLLCSLCSVSLAQEFFNLLSLSIPAIVVRSGGDRGELFVNGSSYVEYDRLITEKVSGFGFATLSAYPVGDRTGVSLGGGGGLRFWVMESFSSLFFGSFGGVEVIDSGKTQTWARLGFEGGFRYLLSDTFSLTVSGGPEVLVGTGPAKFGLSARIGAGFGF